MGKRWLGLVGFMLLGVGCDDPADTVAQSFPSGPQAVNSAPAEAPPPGDGENPQPPPETGDLVPAGPGGDHPVPDGQQKVTAGEGVMISGTVTYTGSQSGAILMDAVRDGDPTGQVVHSFILNSLGPFQVEAPKDLGEIYLTVFVDPKGDGPSKGDPAGYYRKALDVGDDAIDGVKISIKDDPDLGRFKPWTFQNAPSNEDVALREGEDPADGAPSHDPGQDGPDGPPDAPPPEGADNAPVDGVAPPATEEAPADGGAPADGDAPAAGGDAAEQKSGGLYKPNGEPWELPSDGSK